MLNRITTVLGRLGSRKPGLYSIIFTANLQPSSGALLVLLKDDAKGPLEHLLHLVEVTAIGV